MRNLSTGETPPESSGQPRRKYFSRAVLPLLTFLAAASLLAQHGFILGRASEPLFTAFDVFLAGCFAAELGFRVFGARRVRQVLHAARFELGVLLLLLGSLALIGLFPARAEIFSQTLFKIPAVPNLAIVLIKLYLLAAIFLQMLKSLQLMIMRGVRAELILVGSMGSLILLGTALLLLPRASSSSAPPLSFIDAFFTSTSAACVTGLTIRDTGGDFSILGQLVLLALIQVGGLGTITFVAFVSVFSGKSLPVPQMVAFKNIINIPALSDIKQRILGILLFTLIVEAAGAAGLYVFLAGHPGGLSERLYWSLFHSVSAFCNAGFSLQSDSLMGYASAPGINIIIMVLVILGGLGFLVIPELCVFVWQRFIDAFRRLVLRWKQPPPRPPIRLSLQSRLALRVGLWVFVLGAFAFLLLESDHLLAGLSWDHAALASLFQTSSGRTAGFNTVPMSGLRDATILLMIVLMVIGASPVSAAGGIKTVTLGVLLLALRSLLLSHDKVEAFGRTIPRRTLIAAMSVFVLYSMSAAMITLLLAIFEADFNMRDHLFEGISALSTVGLSTGVTPTLTPASKLLLCAAMFIGRIGPIALVLSIFRASRRIDYDFPSEEVVVG